MKWPLVSRSRHDRELVRYHELLMAAYDLIGSEYDRAVKDDTSKVHAFMVEADHSGIHRYGSFPDGTRNTIHNSHVLSIEVDDDGKPTAVWFRCLNLPFHTWRRDSDEPVRINPGGMHILNIEYEEKENTT